MARSKAETPSRYLGLRVRKGRQLFHFSDVSPKEWPNFLPSSRLFGPISFGYQQRSLGNWAEELGRLHKHKIYERSFDRKTNVKYVEGNANVETGPGYLNSVYHGQQPRPSVPLPPWLERPSAFQPGPTYSQLGRRVSHPDLKVYQPCLGTSQPDLSASQPDLSVPTYALSLGY